MSRRRLSNAHFSRTATDDFALFIRDCGIIVYLFNGGDGGRGRVERAVLKVKEDPVCPAAMRRRSGRDGLGGAGAESLGRFICIIDRGHDMRRPSHNEFFHCRPFVSRDRRRSDYDLSRRPLKDPLMTEKPDTVCVRRVHSAGISLLGPLLAAFLFDLSLPVPDLSIKS